MSFTCETLLTCRNNTKLLVNEIIMDYDLPRTMRVQAKVFMELIDAWPLRIFVYDMFSVDIKLMLKFVTEDNRSQKSAIKKNYVNNIMLSIKPVLYCERFFGIFRFYVTKEGDIVPIEGNIYHFISMIIYLEQDLEMFMFCNMILMLKSRLEIINGYLMRFVHEKDANKTPIFIINDREISSELFNFVGRVSHNNMKIRDLAALYNTTGNICSLINEVFQFQIFMNLVSTFIFVIVAIWEALYYFRSPDTTADQLVTIIIWCILTIFSVAVMSFTCETLLTCRNNTKLLVNEIIMDYDLPRTMRVQAKVFMELIDAWPLRIFVYDMFSVDIKLMLKFVSVATTYLIVIIQISHFV
ncbi:uncharacterized protein LOC126371594 [Pectinophora gossypiella]|uniref:uncharacterized protein LOC126371594 n=1 Tax=Pectinophora gossypiella TaxID=13191 RepID=UPI00214E9ABE|nr:uncharacterized protein LOC126371594 [Pectinophora gossypiella]